MSETAPQRLKEKLLRATEIISGADSAVVAFSGGVDSSLLLALAVRSLGPDKVLAVTALGPLTSEEDARSATDVARMTGAAHRVVQIDPLLIPGFTGNDPERCYVCKKNLLAALDQIRAAEGLAAIFDGSIADDADDFRPGGRAAAEARVIQPLAGAGLTKEEVREASRQFGLPTSERPSSPCLASRFPYGEPITAEALQMVGSAEALLHRSGFPVARVRHHGHLARIEVPVDQIPLLAADPLRSVLLATLRDLGYSYVTLDLQGFRSGSLNEVL